MICDDVANFICSSPAISLKLSFSVLTPWSINNPSHSPQCTYSWKGCPSREQRCIPKSPINFIYALVCLREIFSCGTLLTARIVEILPVTCIRISESWLTVCGRSPRDRKSRRHLHSHVEIERDILSYANCSLPIRYIPVRSYLVRSEEFQQAILWPCEMAPHSI